MIQDKLLPQGPKYHTLTLDYGIYLDMERDISNTIFGNYFVFDCIGQGGFGQVYLGMDHHSKNKVALKLIDLRLIQQESNSRLKEIKLRLSQSEDQNMTACNSPNLVKCLDVYENADLKIIVTEYCNGGTLFDFIEQKKRVPEPQAIIIIKQIINGLAELHSRKIIHRDLKAENILRNNGTFKIADFGFSKRLNIKNDDVISIHTLLGTECTMAPEVINHEKYGLKADIWSIGIIFYQMLYGELPFASARRHQIKDNQGMRKRLFKNSSIELSQEARDFLTATLNTDQDQRIGWLQLIAHPIFSPKNEKGISEMILEYPNHVVYNPEGGNLTKELQRVQGERGILLKATQEQIEEKKKEVQLSQVDKFYAYLVKVVPECVKVSFIYSDIILQLEKTQNFDLAERQSIQLLYLIASRCFLDLSPIQYDIAHCQPSQHSFGHCISQITSLYQKIKSKWQRYCDALTKKENSILSIIIDFFQSTQAKKQKEVKLNGIDNHDFSKQQHVAFIEANYIRPLILKNGVKPHLRVRDLLRFYKDITLADPAYFKEKGFEAFVEDMLNHEK